MTYEPNSERTRAWTNVLLNEVVGFKRYRWLESHAGGRYHIHRSSTAIKFERAQDAEWFIMRWL